MEKQALHILEISILWITSFTLTATMANLQAWAVIVVNFIIGAYTAIRFLFMFLDRYKKIKVCKTDDNKSEDE